MLLNFAAVIDALGPGAAIRIANAPRPQGDYLFARFLPNRNVASYFASGGAMTIKPTMAGLVGMDSHYPPGGVASASTWAQNLAKLAIGVHMPEGTIRQLQALLQSAAAGAAAGAAVPSVDLTEEAISFYDTVIVQPVYDTMEYLRSAALVDHAIDWTSGNIRLQVDYGIPSAQRLATRTGTAAWGDSASGFWDDVRALQRVLKNQVLAFVLNSDTLDVVLGNTANNAFVAAQAGNVTTIRRQLVAANGGMQLSDDARDTIQLITYDREGSVLDPANPGQTIDIPFMSSGKLLAVGRPGATGYRAGASLGSVAADPAANTALGYTHVGPTVENNGATGVWGRVFTPEMTPWNFRGEAAANALPVIEDATKVAVASSDMPA